MSENITQQEEHKTATPKEPFVKFGLKNPEDLIKVVEFSSTLVDELTIEASQEGLSIRAMDPSHVGLIDIAWPNAAFDQFEVIEIGKFAVRTDEFFKVLKNFDKKEPILVIVQDGEIVIRSDNERFNMRVIESYNSNTPLPKLTYNAKFTLDKTALNKMAKIQTVSEYVTIETEQHSQLVKMSGKGDSGEYQVQFESSNGLEELNVKENSKSTYSLNYLLKWTKLAAKYGSSMTFEFSTKMPLRVEQRIANVGRIHYYLAPRVIE